jgi:AMIN domain
MQKFNLKTASRNLAAIALLAPAALAQNLTVRSVSLLSAAGQPQIEVKTSGPVSPATQAVTGPDRIVIDFPGALPASTLQKIAVHRGGLQRIRTGLFQSQPPITRIVLDVDGPTDYQVVPSGNSIVIKLGHPGQASPAPSPTVASKPQPPTAPAASVKLASAAPTPSPATFRPVKQTSLPALQVVNTVAAPSIVPQRPAPPPRPPVDVAVRSNLMSIRAQGATLAEVLYEIHRRTGADIAIPAGAEQERVVVNIPSAPGRDVIASLLNGSRFNYIVLGTDNDPGGFRNLLLSLKEGGAGGGSGVFVHNDAPPQSPAPAGMQPQSPDPIAEQPQLDPTAAPQLEPIPEDTSANEPETSPDTQHPTPPQEPPIQNVPEAGQVPQ